MIGSDDYSEESGPDSVYQEQGLTIWGFDEHAMFLLFPPKQRHGTKVPKKERRESKAIVVEELKGP